MVAQCWFSFRCLMTVSSSLHSKFQNYQFPKRFIFFTTNDHHDPPLKVRFLSYKRTMNRYIPKTIYQMIWQSKCTFLCNLVTSMGVWNNTSSPKIPYLLCFTTRSVLFMSLSYHFTWIVFRINLRICKLYPGYKQELKVAIFHRFL